MRVLLDECVTRYLKRDFTGREVFTVEEAGLKGLKNGRLLQAMSGHFDLLVTVDQNLQYQQNLTAYAVAIVVLRARRSTYQMLKPFMPELLAHLENVKPGEVVVIS
jgi:hypothetical protein